MATFLPLKTLPASRSSFAGTTLQACRPMQRPLVLRSPVVAMAKPTKATEFRSLTDEQIKTEIETIQRKLYFLRQAKSTRQEFKPHLFRFNRRKIAQLLTVARERSIAQGISKRENKKKERQERVFDGFGNIKY